jgi:N-acetylglucosamine kinase-like BadF-type ATPase
MDYILGIDGGATKTSAQVVDTDGNLIIEKIAGSSNYKSAGIATAKASINSLLFELIDGLGINENIKTPVFRAACIGLAGCDTEDDIEIYKKIIFNKKINKFLPPDDTIICNDSKIGLHAGSDKKNKVMLISGTGANCYGVNEKGEEASANGWDYLLGDEGSGYSIGIRALRAVMKSYDGRGPKTLLTEKILQDLKLKKIPDLIKWAYNEEFSKEKIACIGKILCDTAELDDKVSVKILKEEANEVFQSAMAVISRLGLKSKDFDLVFVGNIFKTDKYFKEILTSKLKKVCPKINFMPLSSKPVTGAIKIAKDLLIRDSAISQKK